MKPYGQKKNYCQADEARKPGYWRGKGRDGRKKKDSPRHWKKHERQKQKKEMTESNE